MDHLKQFSAIPVLAILLILSGLIFTQAGNARSLSTAVAASARTSVAFASTSNPPVPRVAQDGMRAMFFIPGAWATRFNAKHGYVPYRDRETFDREIANAMADIKKTGANTVVVSTVTSFVDPDNNSRRDTRTIYFKWLDTIISEAEKNGLVVVPSFYPGRNVPGSNLGIWVRTCIDTFVNKKMVIKYGSHPSVQGFNCAFEQWNNKIVSPVVALRVKRMFAYLRSKKSFYMTVPAAGVSAPNKTFSFIFAQLNPTLYPNVQAMDQIVSANSRASSRGLQFNGYHGQIPNGNKTAYRIWYNRQMASILKFKPKHVMLFAYGHIVSDRARIGNTTYIWGDPRPYIRRIWSEL